MIPIFLIARDRVTCLSELAKWCEGQLDPIVIIDNDSTYPPLLEWYRTCPYKVIFLGKNLKKWSPWRSGIVQSMKGDEFYIVSDPDVLPVDECPRDWLELFKEALTRYKEIIKVGFGLTAGNEDNPVQSRARTWAKKIQSATYRKDKRFWSWGIDSTFALYRSSQSSLIDKKRILLSKPALRSKPPYVAAHEGWHLDIECLSEELRYYYRHAQNRGFMMKNFRSQAQCLGSSVTSETQPSSPSDLETPFESPTPSPEP
jgi:hypothetical protein